LVECI